MARYTTPERLIGATDFSGDPTVNDPIWLMKTIRATAWIWRDLKAAADGLEEDFGRPRSRGEWPLAYLAFAASRVPDIQPWYDRTSAELWIEAGFEAKPPYGRVYERFCELEQIADAFRTAAARLIQHARRHEPRIGAHVHVDSTEAETHAALVHVCCPPKRGKRSKRGMRPEREYTHTERERRQAAADEPAPDRTRPELGAAEKVRLVDGRKQVKVNGHWYQTTDRTAGIRAYTGPRGAPKFWHGFYNQKVIDHFTGATLAVRNFNASIQEHICYPRTYEHLRENLGADPEAMVADRGFSIRSVFEHNTRRGVASVIPFRRDAAAKVHRPDHDAVDRHGIVRCKHCGGETTFVRFSANLAGSPRLWVRCQLQTMPECKRDQTITCARDWRLLLPLWRTDVTYHQLRASHESYERGHDDWRQRYCVAGDNRSTRPKRRGISCQELRSQAALAIEWTCLCHREGWLGSARTSATYVKEPNGQGARAVRGLLRTRRLLGLNTPYGRGAVRCGIGELTPPSARAAKADAAKQAALAALPRAPSGP